MKLWITIFPNQIQLLQGDNLKQLLSQKVGAHNYYS